MGEVRTVEREMTDRERALAVLLEIAEDESTDAATRLKAAEIVIARDAPKRSSLMSNYAKQQAG